MRAVAMRLHTPQQAPKEGQKKPDRVPEQTPPQRWDPTLASYASFLRQSLIVYDTLENAVSSAPDGSPLASLRGCGLERAPGLRRDLAWLAAEHGIDSTAVDDADDEEAPGPAYARLLQTLLDENTPSGEAAFVCHWYNTYFAHTAGGLMIGRKLADSLLDGKTLEFYKWYEGGNDVGSDAGASAVEIDHKPLLEETRRRINALAEGWGEEDKKRCLDETEQSFRFSGAILREVAKPPKGAAAGA